jgi:hypothetical protein
MTTTTEARDAIMGLLRTAWLSDATTAPIALLWDNVKGDKPGEEAYGQALPWARAAIRHNLGEQETIAAQGNRRYLAGGVFTVQVFTPPGDGHSLSDQIVEVVKTAMRNVASTVGVWFYNIRVTEMGVDGPWFNVNVDAVFRYQERA